MSSVHENYWEAKYLKQGQQLLEATSGTDFPKFFTGKCFWLDGVEATRFGNLTSQIPFFGGQVVFMRANLTGGERYIVAETFPDFLREAVAKSRGVVRVVRPEWVISCMMQGELVDWSPYSLMPLEPRLNFHGQQGAPSAAASGSSPKPLPRPPPGLAQTSGYDPGFLKKYLSNSRLNKLGTWRSSILPHLTRLVQVMTHHDRKDVLREHVGGGENAYPPSTTPSTFLHIDLDCFFVQVCLKSRPDLMINRDCLAVAHVKRGGKGGEEEGEGGEDQEEGGDEQAGSGSGSGSGSAQQSNSRAEISSCSYPARKFGVRAGMSVGEATELCREKGGVQLTVLDYDFPAIQEKSQLVMGTICSQVGGSPTLFPLSLDEAFLDVSGYAHPEAAAVKLREDLARMTGLTCSIGVGITPTLARLATSFAKPPLGRGVYGIKGNPLPFLAPLATGRLHGIGRATEVRLQEELGVATVGELQARSEEELKGVFGGEQGGKLYWLARGGLGAGDIYKSEALTQSVSVQATYGVRFPEGCPLSPMDLLKDMAKELSVRLEEAGMEESYVSSKPPKPLLARTLTLTVRTKTKDTAWKYKGLGHGWPNLVASRSETLPSASSDYLPLHTAACAALRALKLPHTDIVGLTVSVKKFERQGAMDKFLLATRPEGEKVKEEVEEEEVEIVGGGRRGSSSSSSSSSSSACGSPSKPQYPKAPSNNPLHFSKAEVNEQKRMLHDSKKEAQKRRRESPEKGGGGGKEEEEVEDGDVMVVIDGGAEATLPAPHPPTRRSIQPWEDALSTRRMVQGWMSRAGEQGPSEGEVVELVRLGVLVVRDGDGEHTALLLRTLHSLLVGGAWHPAFARVERAMCDEYTQRFGAPLSYI